MFRRIEEYFLSTSLHGFHFILERDRHWTERVFWVVVCCLSCFGAWICLEDAIYAFKNDAVTFVVETDYLNWNTTFPAVSICEHKSLDRLDDIARKLYDGNQSTNNINFFLQDIVFFDGTCSSCSTLCSKDGLDCGDDFDTIIKKFREKCKDLISNCKWNGIQFPCCNNFLPLYSEQGLCFTINSIHTKKYYLLLRDRLTIRKSSSLPMLTSNRQSGPGILELEPLESVKVYTHSYEDVPYANQLQDLVSLLNWGSVYSMRIQIVEIVNDRNVPSVSIQQRNCRLPEETDLDVYKYYGYAPCVVNCRARVQTALCNCSSHYIPWRDKRGKRTCGIQGLNCLTLHAELIRTLKKEDLMQFNITACECLSSCNEPEFAVVSSRTNLKDSDNSSYSDTKIIIELDRLPTLRYVRRVVRTPLDLVVSIGGTIGLFLGASILSIVELWYYLFLRAHSLNSKNVQEKEPVKNPVENRSFIETSFPISSSISELVSSSRQFQTQRQIKKPFSYNRKQISREERVFRGR